MSPFVLGAVIVLGVAGAAYTIENLRSEIAMEGQHWIMLLVILLVGYAAGRLFPQLGQAVGLP